MVLSVNKNFTFSPPQIHLLQEAIICAIRTNDFSKLKSLLEQLSSFSSIDRQRELLELAIESRAEEALCLLLNHGIIPDQETLLMTLAKVFTNDVHDKTFFNRAVKILSEYQFNPFHITSEENNIFITRNFHSEKEQKEFIDHFFALYWETQFLAFKSMSLSEIAINGISMIREKGYYDSMQKLREALINQECYIPCGCFGLKTSFGRFYQLLCYREGYSEAASIFISNCPSLGELSPDDFSDDNIYVLFTQSFLDSAFLSPGGLNFFAKQENESIFSKALEREDIIFNDCFARIVWYHLANSVLVKEIGTDISDEFTPSPFCIDDCMLFLKKTFSEVYRLGRAIPKTFLANSRVEYFNYLINYWRTCRNRNE